MAEIKWGSKGSKVYETGLSHGVLYPPSRPGVPWNGLVQVSETSTAAEPTPYYIDGLKIMNIPHLGEYTGKLDAFTYPSEFEEFDGLDGNGHGLFLTHQPRGSFGLSYRTSIGDDVSGPDSGYKIHILYNVTATPSPRNYQTSTDNPELMTFSWDLTTRPEVIPGYSPTAHFVVDSRRTDPETMSALWDILYGTSKTHPRLLTRAEIIKFFSVRHVLQIVLTSTGLHKLTYEGRDDISGSPRDGLYRKSTGTALVEQVTEGLYRLDPK